MVVQRGKGSEAREKNHWVGKSPGVRCSRGEDRQSGGGQMGGGKRSLTDRWYDDKSDARRAQT